MRARSYVVVRDRESLATPTLILQPHIVLKADDERIGKIASFSPEATAERIAGIGRVGSAVVVLTLPHSRGRGLGLLPPRSVGED